jgi:hypothetical protein
MLYTYQSRAGIPFSAGPSNSDRLMFTVWMEALCFSVPSSNKARRELGIAGFIGLVSTILAVFRNCSISVWLMAGVWLAAMAAVARRTGTIFFIFIFLLPRVRERAATRRQFATDAARIRAPGMGVQGLTRWLTVG